MQMVFKPIKLNASTEEEVLGVGHCNLQAKQIKGSQLEGSLARQETAKGRNCLRKEDWSIMSNAVNNSGKTKPENPQIQQSEVIGDIGMSSFSKLDQRKLD